VWFADEAEREINIKDDLISIQRVLHPE